jgi:hypothetical protein
VSICGKKELTIYSLASGPILNIRSIMLRFDKKPDLGEKT